jgi:hypothetical protein
VGYNEIVDHLLSAIIAMMRRQNEDWTVAFGMGFLVALANSKLVRVVFREYFRNNNSCDDSVD